MHSAIVPMILFQAQSVLRYMTIELRQSIRVDFRTELRRIKSRQPTSPNLTIRSWPESCTEQPGWRVGAVRSPWVVLKKGQNMKDKEYRGTSHQSLQFQRKSDELCLSSIFRELLQPLPFGGGFLVKNLNRIYNVMAEKTQKSSASVDESARRIQRLS